MDLRPAALLAQATAVGVTDGGRVLCVVGAGDSVLAARDAAYEVVRKVAWDGAFFRTDIGHRALQRQRR